MTSGIHVKLNVLWYQNQTLMWNLSLKTFMHKTWNFLCDKQRIQMHNYVWNGNAFAFSQL